VSLELTRLAPPHHTQPPNRPTAKPPAAPSGTAPKTLYRAPSASNLARIPSTSSLDTSGALPNKASHPWHDIPIGDGAPDEITAIIEIPAVRWLGVCRVCAGCVLGVCWVC